MDSVRPCGERVGRVRQCRVSRDLRCPERNRGCKEDFKQRNEGDQIYILKYHLAVV